jgi:hypothetical protein
MRLRFWELADAAEDRPQQLVHGSEWELRLRFDPAAAEHAHVLGLFARILEERRLADARLTADDEHTASRPARSVEKLADQAALRVSAVEHLATSYAAKAGEITGATAGSPRHC